MLRPPASRPNNVHKNPPGRPKKKGEIRFNTADSLHLLRCRTAKKTTWPASRKKAKTIRTARRLKGATKPQRGADRTPVVCRRAAVDGNFRCPRRRNRF